MKNLYHRLYQINPDATILLKEHTIDICAKIKLFDVVKNLDLETANYDTQFLKKVMENAWGTLAPTNGLSLAKSYVRNMFQATRDNKDLPFPENCKGYRIIKVSLLLIVYLSI